MPGRGAQPVYGYSGHGHFTPLLGDAGRCHGPPDRRVVFGAGIPCKLSLRSRTPRALPFPMAGCHLRVQLGTAGPGGDRSHPNRLGRLGWPSPDFMEHKGDSNQFEPCSCPSRRTGVAGNKVQSAQSINDACLSAGGPGCKLCPTDWQLRGDKCYWFSRGRNTWNASRVDCSARGSQLLVIRDREELFIKDLTQGSNQFWVGLSISSPEKAWIWVDVKPFPSPPWAEEARARDGGGLGGRSGAQGELCSVSDDAETPGGGLGGPAERGAGWEQTGMGQGEICASPSTEMVAGALGAGHVAQRQDVE
uniref:C-type lectin domain-containing protein n=1 Tax=Chrysemys picta bellii TaxID=8478 RepID=A0A8C3I283_CHRPI